MIDPEWVTPARARELLAVEDAGGVRRPLAPRALSGMIARGELETMRPWIDQAWGLVAGADDARQEQRSG